MHVGTHFLAGWLVAGWPLGGSADATARLETVIPAAAAGTRVAAAIFLVIFIGGLPASSALSASRRAATHRYWA